MKVAAILCMKPRLKQLVKVTEIRICVVCFLHQFIHAFQLAGYRDFLIFDVFQSVIHMDSVVMNSRVIFLFFPQ